MIEISNFHKNEPLNMLTIKNLQYFISKQDSQILEVTVHNEVIYL